MTEEDKAIPTMLQRWKDRHLIKKQKEIEMLKLRIEEAKLHKELKEVIKSIKE